MAKRPLPCSELEATGDALQAERAALKNEVQRWKDRVNGLIEKYNKIEPEEVKKLMQVFFSLYGDSMHSTGCPF